MLTCRNEEAQKTKAERGFRKTVLWRDVDESPNDIVYQERTTRGSVADEIRSHQAGIREGRHQSPNGKEMQTSQVSALSRALSSERRTGRPHHPGGGTGRLHNVGCVHRAPLLRG